MKTYKSINYNFFVTFESSEESYCLPDLHLIDKQSDYGFSKINENFIVTILEERKVDVGVHKEEIYNFICFFLKNRIVLTEKIKNNENLITFIKNYWNNIKLMNSDTYEITYRDEDDYFVFKSISVNIVKMSNNTEVLIPTL